LEDYAKASVYIFLDSSSYIVFEEKQMIHMAGYNLREQLYFACNTHSKIPAAVLGTN
jgi:hypothetical protein